MEVLWQIAGKVAAEDRRCRPADKHSFRGDRKSLLNRL